MKNMVLLIDANVILNYLLDHEPESEYARQIIDCCREKKVRGYMAFHTVSIVWYVLRKKPLKERRQIMLDLCKMITVCGASHEAVIEAIVQVLLLQQLVRRVWCLYLMTNSKA